MPVPTTLFATLQTSLASTSAALGALKALGPGATVAELIGATTGLEVLTVAGSMLGVFYLGAVIGSLMVATNAVAECKDPGGLRSSVAIATWGAGMGLAVPPIVIAHMLRHPEVLAPTKYTNYGVRARFAPRGKQ
ncbi:hypothetical protein [Burkholderia gladioli]|uniref:hypothetical protein n=1 Tax=Burkholderia gladioli TaxID=28095 RepID=UPI001FC8BB32|nr:hypothetical protein [Burkholderia gladioli]